MRDKNGLMVAIVIVLIIIVGTYAVMRVNISALPEPGPFEPFIVRLKAKYFPHEQQTLSGVCHLRTHEYKKGTPPCRSGKNHAGNKDDGCR